MNAPLTRADHANMALREFVALGRPARYSPEHWTFGCDGLPHINPTDDDNLVEDKMCHRNDDGDSLESLGCDWPERVSEMEFAA